MLAGYTYDSQLFTSEAFRKFQNEFIDGNCGVLDGMNVTTTNTTASIADGWAIIKGGLLREQGGTTLSLTNNGYYIVALQIDLSQTNTETDFNQGSLVALRGTNDYPTLVQQDLTAGGTMYQMGLAKFQKTDNGISNFEDIRPNLNWTSLYTKYAQELQSLEDLSSVITTDGNKTITGSLEVQGGITGDVTGDVTGNTSGSSGSCTGNSATATKLATARQINGTNFDGSGNITTNKWGTSRNIALSGAVSGNANVDGSGNVTITTTQANIAVITGNWTVTATTNNPNKTIPYPSGFNQTNCVVIATLIKGISSSGLWTDGSEFISGNLTSGGVQCRTTLRSSDIYLGYRCISFINNETATVWDINAGTNLQYKIVLMKIS